MKIYNILSNSIQLVHSIDSIYSAFSFKQKLFICVEETGAKEDNPARDSNDDSWREKGSFSRYEHPQVTQGFDFALT